MQTNYQNLVKLFFKRLLCNVTKNTVFSFNGHLYKQIDGYGMENPLSPVLANIFMVKLEPDVIRPYSPRFYFMTSMLMFVSPRRKQEHQMIYLIV